MEDFDGSFSLSSLMCQEDETCLIQETGEENSCGVNFNCDPCFVLGNGDEEFIEKLVEKEIDFGPKGCGFPDDSSNRSQSWLKCARLNAIEWIFNVCFSFKAIVFILYCVIIYIFIFMVF